MTHDASHNATVHNLLPLDAQALLRRAAATRVTDTDPMARIRAVDQAIKRVKREHSRLFSQAALHNYSTVELEIPTI
jgi:hypothetical protein